MKKGDRELVELCVGTVVDLMKIGCKKGGDEMSEAEDETSYEIEQLEFLLIDTREKEKEEEKEAALV